MTGTKVATQKSASPTSATKPGGGAGASSQASCFKGAVDQAKAGAQASSPAAQSGVKTLESAERRIEQQLKSAPPAMRAELQDTLKELRGLRQDLQPRPQPPAPPSCAPAPVWQNPPPSQRDRKAQNPGTPHPPQHPLPPPGTGGAHPGPGIPSGPKPPASPHPGGTPPVGSHPNGQAPNGQGSGPSARPPEAGASGTGAGAAKPTPFDPAKDPLVDGAKWAKELLFSARAFGRLPIEGWDGKGGLAGGQPPVGWVGKAADATKVVGLGGFAIAANIQKGGEIYGYLTSGDPGDKWRAGASGAEFVNNLRLGYAGFMPLMRSNAALTSFGEKYVGGAFGQKFGVGANALAGTLKIGGVWQDYRGEIGAAQTGRDRDMALYKAEERTLGTLFDTANDIYPYVSKAEPLAWASWLGGKLADHGAQAMLQGAAYKPVSLGAEKARNLMPLASAVGLAPDVPLREITPGMSADERLVAQFDNGIHKAAGIGSGVTDVAVTTVEFAGVAYLTRGKGTAPVFYATLQIDHMLRQGANVWTDQYWQRPAERASAVQQAGLDPKLDTRKVVHEQPDFLHRIWAERVADFTSGYLDGREDFGKTTASEQRWLDLDRQYTSSAISTKTGRTSDAWYVQAFSPESMNNAMRIALPAYGLSETLFSPENLGKGAAYVQEGWTRTSDAVSSGWNSMSGAVSQAWNRLF